MLFLLVFFMLAGSLGMSRPVYIWIGCWPPFPCDIVALDVRSAVADTDVGRA